MEARLQACCVYSQRMQHLRPLESKGMSDAAAHVWALVSVAFIVVFIMMLITIAITDKQAERERKQASDEWHANERKKQIEWLEQMKQERAEWRKKMGMSDDI